MSDEANELLRGAVRLMLAYAVVWAAIGDAAYPGPHPATSPAPTTLARMIIQNTGSMVHPRFGMRRVWTDHCPLRLDCDGFVWT